MVGRIILSIVLIISLSKYYGTVIYIYHSVIILICNFYIELVLLKLECINTIEGKGHMDI